MYVEIARIARNPLRPSKHSAAEEHILNAIIVVRRRGNAAHRRRAIAFVGDLNKQLSVEGVVRGVREFVGPHKPGEVCAAGVFPEHFLHLAGGVASHHALYLRRGTFGVRI